MRTPKLTILLTTTTLLAALVPASTATDVFSLPAMDTVAYGGAGWAAYKFSTDGSIVGATVWLTNAQSAQAGADLFDASGNLLFGFTFTAIGSPESGTRLDVTTPPPVGQHIEYGSLDGSGVGGAMGLGMALNDPDFGAGTPGTYILLLWGAGQLDSTTISLVGGAGDAMLGKTTGTNAFLYGANDFASNAMVHSFDGTNGAHAVVDGQKSVTVTNTLYGVFYDANFKIACAIVCAGGPSTSVLTADTPTGTQVCSDVGFCGYFGSAAGTYTFHLTQVDAFTTSGPFVCEPAPAVGYACAGAIALQDAVILGGVDASLPI